MYQSSTNNQTRLMYQAILENQIVKMYQYKGVNIMLTIIGQCPNKFYENVGNELAVLMPEHQITIKNRFQNNCWYITNILIDHEDVEDVAYIFEQTDIHPNGSPFTAKETAEFIKNLYDQNSQFNQLDANNLLEDLRYA